MGSAARASGASERLLDSCVVFGEAQQAPSSICHIRHVHAAITSLSLRVLQSLIILAAPNQTSEANSSTWIARPVHERPRKTTLKLFYPV
jgi:hypothetical protein